MYIILLGYRLSERGSDIPSHVTFFTAYPVLTALNCFKLLFTNFLHVILCLCFLLWMPINSTMYNATADILHNIIAYNII